MSVRGAVFTPELQPLAPHCLKPLVGTLHHHWRGLVWYDDASYCGARESSGWNTSPWGSNLLCVVHYVAWKRTKTLKLPAEVRLHLCTSRCHTLHEALVDFSQLYWKQFDLRCVPFLCWARLCAETFEAHRTRREL